MKVIKVAGKVVAWICGGCLFILTLGFAKVGLGMMVDTIAEVNNEGCEDAVSTAAQRIFTKDMNGWTIFKKNWYKSFSDLH